MIICFLGECEMKHAVADWESGKDGRRNECIRNYEAETWKTSTLKMEDAEKVGHADILKFGV